MHLNIIDHALRRQKTLSNFVFRFLIYRALWMDGWMTCDFTSFSTVFQSYQDDGQMIMKGCVQWNSVYG